LLGGLLGAVGFIGLFGFRLISGEHVWPGFIGGGSRFGFCDFRILGGDFLINFA
jgi:hypothetical protein